MPDTVRQAPIAPNDRYRCGDSGSCSSSPAVSPSHSFKRSKSTFYLLDRRTSPPPGRILQPRDVGRTAVGNAVDWYAAFFWKLIRTLFASPLLNALLVQAPSRCLALWLRTTWACVRVPLVVLHACSFVLRRRGSVVSGSGGKGERLPARRTVLINGGSTVQALHLARNFYLSGARVIVCEVKGRASAELSSFSVAVDGHYTVPEPNEHNCVQYVDALRTIVERERVGYYVPTGTTVSTYYDAVAKPHLELLGCKCCTPGLDDVSVLNDLSEVFLKCEAEGLPVPKHLRVCSKDDIVKLYDNVSFRADKHFIVNVGLSGCKASHRLQLPASRKSLTLPGPVSDDCPWLLVQNCPGSYYTTCTTVHDGRVIANVTCSVRAGGATTAAGNELIDGWVTHFVGSLSLAFDCVLSFRVCVTPSRNVVPIGCRVGVPTEYTAYSKSNVEGILFPPCANQHHHHHDHDHGSSAVPETEITGRYYAAQLVYDTVGRFTNMYGTTRQFVDTVFTKKEMIFTYWDPLPFFVYYNIPTLLDHINGALDKAMLSGHKNKYTTF